MINNKIRNSILEYGANNGLHFTLIDGYDNSIVGTALDKIVYSKSKMISEHSKNNNCSIDEAQEWIDYNIIRALPYYPEVIIIDMDIEDIQSIYGTEGIECD